MRIETSARAAIIKCLTIATALCSIAMLASTAAAQVVINEIMYHPYEPWPATQPYRTTNATEFLEIYNAGAAPVDLSSYRLDNGVSYNFPNGTVIGAGAYLVICEDLAAFTTAYTTVTNVVGQFSGGLKNSGERVTLSRDAGGTSGWVRVHSIEYVDFPNSTDGEIENRTLELVHPAFAAIDQPYYGTWGASRTASGTPGRVNSIYDSTPRPVVGDVSHNPPLPFPGSVVTVSARALGRGGAPDMVEVQYRKNALVAVAWEDAAVALMHDDGLHGDAVAGDGIYSAQLPGYGEAPMANGEILEFRIIATDTYGEMIAPGVNTSGDVAGPYTYLCKFGEDTAYDGEYVAYHMIVTEVSKTAIEAQSGSITAPRPLYDGTFISSEGKILYNCGVRLRGGSSSTQSPYNYRVEFPKGRTVDGHSELNFNHVNALHQYIGLEVFERAGYGIHTLDHKLRRLWLNNVDKSDLAGHKIYHQFERLGPDFFARNYGSSDGNLYWSDGDDFPGGLEPYPDLAGYKASHLYSTNNPYTAWTDFTNLVAAVNQYPPVESNLVKSLDPRYWARFFAVNVGVDNEEWGIGQPGSTTRDEMRVFSDPRDGQFDIYPWDMDSTMGNGTAFSVWAWVGIQSNLVGNEPMLKFYRHDVRDIIENVMSDANMNALYDSMGSRTATRRAAWISNVAAIRTSIRGEVGTGDAGPAAPTGLSFTNLTATSVTLNWTDGGPDEEWFEIERSSDGSTWEYLAYVEANVTTYTDTRLEQNTEYFYRVRALDQLGRSAFATGSSITAFLQTDALLRDYLRVTEIMYNPTNGSECLELMNTHGSQALDLSGVYFTSGEPFMGSYVFTNGTSLAPGAFLVLVSDPIAFSTRYPGVPTYGSYDGSLDNGGEQIRMRAPNGANIIDFEYDDVDNGWTYLSTDGQGYSLVLVDPAGISNDPTSADRAARMGHPSQWRSSTNPGGSPGAADPAPAYGIVVINEVLSHQDSAPGDWIELYNPGTATVIIANWYLSDDATNLTKFKISSPAFLLPGGYAVFSEDAHFGTNVLGMVNGFALSELGDAVYLSSGDGAGLTSYRAYETFGASENGVSFGRYVKSDGDMDFAALSSKTSGSTNAYPKVGPIVISEVMYNPAAGGKEYVEIGNTSGGAVALAVLNGYGTTNGWLFDAAMEYRFPLGSSLAAGEYALVTGIEPSVFRATFGIPAGIQIFGPYAGDLNNNGETVKLYKPGNPEVGGFVPRILADRVKYADAPPWPIAADNGGASLERRVLTEYGNDVTNWMAGTALGGTPGEINNTTGLPTVAFRLTGSTRVEAAETFDVAVLLNPACATTVTVDYVVGGTATGHGSDHGLLPGTVTFMPGVTSNNIALRIIDTPAANEPDETVIITLQNLSPNAWLGGRRIYTHTIVDNDLGAIVTPTILPAAANFTNYVDVTMSSTTPGALVYYTTDGSTPTTASRLYTNTVHLTHSARIKAKAFIGSLNGSSQASKLYLEQAGQPKLRITNPPNKSLFVTPFSPTFEVAIASNQVSGTLQKVEYFHGGANKLGEATAAPWSLALGPDALATYGVYSLTAKLTDSGGTFISAPVWITVRETSHLPYTDSFESYSTGTPIDGVHGWMAAGDPAEVRVVETNYTYAGIAPIAGNHQRALLIESAVSNKFMNTEATTTVWVDMLLTGYPWAGDTPPPVDPKSQLACYINMTNQLVVLHTPDPAGQPAVKAWTPLTETYLPTGQSFRATFQVDYANRDANGFYYYSVWLDGAPVTNTQALFATAYTNNGHFAGFKLSGEVTLDDVVISDTAPFDKTPLQLFLDLHYPGVPYGVAAASDTDNDGATAEEEFAAGTNPTNGASVFMILGADLGGLGPVIQWLSVTTRYYTVYRSTNLLLPGGGWIEPPLTSGYRGELSGINSLGDTNYNGTATFYRIETSSP